MRNYLLLFLCVFTVNIYAQVKPQQLDVVEESTGQSIYIIADLNGDYQEAYLDSSYCINSDLFLIYNNIKDDMIVNSELIKGGCSANSYVVTQEIIGDTIYYYHSEFNASGIPTGIIDTTFSYTPIIVSGDLNNVIIEGADGGAYLDCSKIKTYEYVDTTLTWQGLTTFTSNVITEGEFLISSVSFSVNGVEQGKNETINGYSISESGGALIITSTETWGSANDPCVITISYVVEDDCCN